MAKTLEEILSRLSQVRQTRPGQWTARCPAHDDQHPSLSVHEASDGRLLLHCFAGCSLAKIATALRIRVTDLFGGSSTRNLTTYDYLDQTGTLLFQVVRSEQKAFRQRRPDGQGGWVWNLEGVRLVLYRLPDLVQAETVLVLEGEKDVETAYRLGLPEGWAATCNAMGAGKWRSEYSDMLKGKRVVILPDADEPGRRHGEQVARSLEGKAAEILTLTIPTGKDLSEWAEAGGTPDQFAELLEKTEAWSFSDSNTRLGPRAELVRLSDVQPEEVSWLWPDHIALGTITFLVGDPGTGKSMLTMDFAARISTGAPFPDGAEASKGTVVLLTAEDGLPETVRPRLDAMHGDARQVFVLTGIRTADNSDLGHFNLSLDLPYLERAITDLNAKLVIIDPLNAYLGGKDTFRDAEVRQVLSPLARLAKETGVAVVGVKHLAKDVRRKALYRPLDSIGFVAAARAVFAVAPDPNSEGRIVFLPLKMNLAPKPPGLAYRVEGLAVQWDTEPVTVDIEHALRGPDHPEKHADRLQAVQVLRYLLQAGPMKVDEVKQETTKAGITERTLQRAKAALGVQSRRAGGIGRAGWWVWELPPSNPSC